MVSTSPPPAVGAKAIRPTQSAKAAINATSSDTRERPCARLAQAKLTMLAIDGAPVTSATARLTLATGSTGA